MALSPFDCLYAELHRDSFEVTKRRRQGEKHPFAEGLLPRYLAGGIDIVVFIVGGDSVTHRDMSDRPLEGSLDVTDFFLNECQAANGKAQIIKYKEDVPTAPSREKVHFVMELEGGRPFQEDYSSGRKTNEKLAALRCFYRLGVRSVQLTHNGRNELADGIWDQRTKGGLSEFGAAVVREMNRLHMMVGVSHLNEQGYYDVLELTTDPIFVTHSNAMSVFDHPRNLTDDQIRALAQNGGLIGIHFLTMMMCKGRLPTLEDFLQHIDYMSELIGPQYLGFGWLGNDPEYTSYFPNTVKDTMVTPEHPNGISMHDQAVVVMEALDKRGYSNDEICGIFGSNYARVMRQVLPSRGQDAIW